MQIRRLIPLDDPADLDDVVALRASWAHDRAGDGDLDELRRRIRDWLRAEGDSRVLWGAYAEEGAVGLVCLLEYTRMPDLGRPPGRWGYVAQLYVRPQARRRGVATALMGALIDHARERGMVRLVLNPSEISRELYASLGFRRADELLLLPLV
ncbi:GNAT family N-acetyltransferase [Arsenicicoccus dermatophilus]|uniref:GNAT family N-acetyltransferase n=1 Tax=Arsenicicoccus dermatophilus TaxID=1076331 RepID=UPI0039174F62